MKTPLINEEKLAALAAMKFNDGEKISAAMQTFVSERLQQLHIPPQPSVVTKLAQYTLLLRDYNDHVNLISRQHRDFNVIFMEHVYDSLLGVPWFTSHKAGVLMSSGKKIRGEEIHGKEIHVLDVGSGAGLPGIPLACVCENLTMTLCESKAKKSIFLKAVCEKLSLHKVEVVSQNVREIAGTYDMITARAFGTIAKIYKLTKHVLRHRPSASVMLLYKGREQVMAAELKEFRKMINHRGPQDSVAIEIHVLSSPHHSSPAEDAVPLAGASGVPKERHLVEITMSQ